MQATGARRIERLRQRLAVLEPPAPLDVLDNPGFELGLDAPTSSGAALAVTGWELVEPRRGSLRLVAGMAAEAAPADVAGRTGLEFSSRNGLLDAPQQSLSAPRHRADQRGSLAAGEAGRPSAAAANRPRGHGGRQGVLPVRGDRRPHGWAAAVDRVVAVRAPGRRPADRPRRVAASPTRPARAGGRRDRRRAGVSTSPSTPSSGPNWPSMWRGSTTASSKATWGRRWWPWRTTGPPFWRPSSTMRSWPRPFARLLPRRPVRPSPSRSRGRGCSTGFVAGGDSRHVLTDRSGTG